MSSGRVGVEPESRVSYASPVRRHVHLLWLLAAAPGIYQLGLLAVTVARRLAYPYDLEWMEGGMLNHALRLAEGQPLYAAPSVEFIPYLYTPLYPALLAGLGKVFGLGYVLGRAISVASILAVVATMVAVLVREGGRRPRALAAAALGGGFFAATYPWVEGWYDLVRGDTLFLAMAVIGLALLRAGARHGRGWLWPRVAAAGALLALSFFCKQVGVVLVAAGGGALIFLNWRALPIYVGVTGLIGGGGSLLLDRLSGGWYWIYVFEVHQQHETHMPRFWRSFANIFGQFPALTAVIAVALVAVAGIAWRRRALPDGAGGFLYWTYMTACGAIVGALGWATQWAHFNAYIPAMTFAAIAGALAVVAVGHWIAGAALAAALGAQLLVARWSPAPFVPAPADRAAGDALIARLRELPGEVFMPSHPWYPRLAGKPTFTHRMGIMDVTFSSSGKKQLRPEAKRVAGLFEALRGGRFGAVVLDDRHEPWEFPGLGDGYFVDEVLPRELAPRVVSGARTAPRYVYRPVERTPPPGTRIVFDFEKPTWTELGFTATGDAWGQGPARGVAGRGPYGWRGARLASSSTIGDRGTGRLVSPPFELAGERLALRVGGGGQPGVRVELVDAGTGEVLHTARGSGTHMMPRVAWDVTALRGRTARLAIIDEEKGMWGILWVDDVRLEGVP
jgi:hypothetical protein